MKKLAHITPSGDGERHKCTDLSFLSLSILLQLPCISQTQVETAAWVEDHLSGPESWAEKGEESIWRGKCKRTIIDRFWNCSLFTDDEADLETWYHLSKVMQLFRDRTKIWTSRSVLLTTALYCRSWFPELLSLIGLNASLSTRTGLSTSFAVLLLHHS